ncbi:MAG: CCA tRNA nucleotidyltransferase [Nanoarchaeota archaeon]
MENTLKNTQKNILTKVKPSNEEQRKLTAVTGAFLAKLNPKLKNAKAILGGSGAKDTWLSGNYDADVFVLFDYDKFKSQSAHLSCILQPALKKAFPSAKILTLHGSRDYFQIPFQGINFEVIPILKIKKAEQALNITDISPLHSKWVNEQGRKVKDEIRLAKQFCKANSLYGAESYINGFSGYVLEILVIHYGSFENLLKAAQKWALKEIIDPSRFYTKKTALFHINQSKLQSPLIIVDPVDKARNAAAALSLDKFISFKKTANEYLHNPEAKYFQKEAVTFEKLAEEAKKSNLIFITAKPKTGKEDVVGTKLFKAFEFIEKKLRPFGIKKSGWEWSGEPISPAVMYFILAKRELPKLEIKQGPPLNMKPFVQDFKRKNKDTFEEKGRIFARVKVKHPVVNDYLNELLKDSYIKERAGKITVKVR